LQKLSRQELFRHTSKTAGTPHLQLLTRYRSAQCVSGMIRGLTPILTTMAGDINSQFESGPDTQLVKSTSQVILDDLLRCAHEFANFTICKPLPHKVGHANFFLG
ncbi:MAG: hypothetical protein WBW60_06315, partial [Candidatus Sulfotelmatobacter sp.]